MSLLQKILFLQKWHIIAAGLLIYDAFVIYVSYYIALYISFKCQLDSIPSEYLDAYLHFSPVYVVFCFIVYWKFRLYNALWRLISYYELLVFSCTVLFTATIYFIVGHSILGELPIRYYVIGGWIQFWLILASRFSFRLLLFLNIKRQVFSVVDKSKRRGMLIGAGAGGQFILRDIIGNNKANIKICCIIDDDPNKLNCCLYGVPIVGGRDSILTNVQKYGIDEILFVIPSISAEDKRDILNICKESGCTLKILPGVYAIVNGDVTLSKMKNVTLEDLLGRTPIKLNLEEILKSLCSKVILVTGGGGSIGSELCRQIAKYHPKQLIIFDIYENNAYDIEQELKRDHEDLNLAVVIGSVRDSIRLKQIFELYKPEIVFHAAAHKHVPLMEGSPCEAIKNNVLGTYKTAVMAMLNGCERFVLISTDKAVNPTNIMGASKRLCEMVVQTLNKINRTGNYEVLQKFLSYHEHTNFAERENLFANITWRTEFVAVRFGNVLGSNGSVIPLFKKQIEHGGPVTVTHLNIIRYFMTIPEAVSLILEAATYAKGGEIFVLDMGEPVKIDSLARNLITLCGYTPDVDIKIVYSGLRPGEKLFEERLMSEEGLQVTQNKLIHIAQPLNWNEEHFFELLGKLAEAAYKNKDGIQQMLKEIVPTYILKQ